MAFLFSSSSFHHHCYFDWVKTRNKNNTNETRNKKRHTLTTIFDGRCVNYGVLPEEEAAKAYKKVLKRKGKQKPGTSTNISSTSVKKAKKTKKIIGDVEYDAGMDAGGDEGIGIAAL